MARTYILTTNDKKDVLPFFRIKSKLSKSELVEKLGLSKPALDKYEREPDTIPTYMFEKFEQVYGSEFMDYYMDNKLYTKD